VTKFLLDQGVPQSAARLLRESGYDAVHTSGIGLASADDAVLLARASAEARTIVTLDADFHALLAVSGASRPSVVRIRMVGLRADAIVRIVESIVHQGASELEAGVAVSVQAGRIRWRKLPV
jgi:predicted nuclease of predicted toxin-antitoxin system